MSSSQSTQRTSELAARAGGRERRGRLWATLAGIALLGAIIWGAIVVVSWGDMIEDLPRTAVPGEVTVEVEQGDGEVIYVERETWTTTTPLDIDVGVEVAGPDGEPVPVDSYDALVNYRWIELVGQAYATFDATTGGTHTVVVAGQVDDDTRITVGPSLNAWPLWQLTGPAAVLMVALITGIVAVTIRQRDRATTSAASDHT